MRACPFGREYIFVGNSIGKELLVVGWWKAENDLSRSCRTFEHDGGIESNCDRGEMGQKEDAERGESYSDAHERYFDAPDWENAMGTTKERKNNLIDWVYTKRALR